MSAIPQFLQQLAAVIGRLGPGKQITLGVLVLATIGGFAMLMAWSGGVDLRPLYANLDVDDAGAIVTRLKEQKIPYRIGADGRSVLVPAASLHEIRMQLASEGLPQGSGVGFEVFDNTKLGMSEFAQNVNYQRALQGELARTVSRIAEVEGCRVHLVMPEKTLFVDQEQPASASVAVRLKPGRRLSQEQINGIVHLVSSSVPRLNPEQITLVDQNGRLLAGNRTRGLPGALSVDQLDYQAQVEKSLEGSVKSMLDQALGEGRAIVRLACAFDFQRREKTEEQYLPDNRVIRSEQSLSENTRNADPAPAGVPGVRSNTPGAEMLSVPAAVGGTAAYEKQDRTVNYEIGKVTSRTIEPTGTLTRVSVAVMVDGTYKEVPVRGGGTQRQYVERSEEEIRKIEALVKRAVNFDPDRGDKVEVVNIPFQVSDWGRAEEAAAPPGWAAYFGEAAAYFKHLFVALFLVLSYIIFVKPLVRWLTEQSMAGVEIVRQLPKTVGELEHEMAGARGLPYLDQASQLVASDSDASVGAVRNWLRQP
jgi:flagellar M-ring protein FliF